MSRTNIHYEEKRDEIARQVFDIFLKNGYENTTLSLIVKELGISKGALYHYFTTKEACCNAAVEYCSKECYKKVMIKIDKSKSAKENFQNLVLSCSTLFKNNEQNLGSINTLENTIFHQKLMAALVKTLAPLYAQVIREGIREKIFETEYPLETAEMILTLTNFYFDSDLFGWKDADMPAKLAAFESFTINALKAKADLFSFLEN